MKVGETLAKLVASGLKELEALIKQKVAKAMEETMAKEVKKLESNNVKEIVYSSYSPTVYERRMDEGGLSDVDNMSHIVSTNGDSIELQVDNNTMSNPEFLPIHKSPYEIAGIVDYGHNGGYGEYEYPTDDDFLQPRRFIEETRNELKYGKAKEFMIKGLKKQGLKVL